MHMQICSMGMGMGMDMGMGGCGCRPRRDDNSAPYVSRGWAARAACTRSAQSALVEASSSRAYDAYQMDTCIRLSMRGGRTR